MDFNVLTHLLAQGPLTVKVTGDCMRPSIQPGLDVRLSRRRAYWPGDILAFLRSDGSIVSHRLLGPVWVPGRGWKMMTRADASPRPDPLVACGHILGKVSHIQHETYRPGATTRLRALAAWARGLFRLVLRRYAGIPST
jgi:hypothetical protein